MDAGRGDARRDLNFPEALVALAVLAIAAVGVALAFALEWIAAALGVYLDVVFQSSHHGLDGLLLVVTALLTLLRAGAAERDAEADLHRTRSAAQPS